MYYVIDNEFNRANNPNLIGLLRVVAPSYTAVQEVILPCYGKIVDRNSAYSGQIVQVDGENIYTGDGNVFEIKGKNVEWVDGELVEIIKSEGRIFYSTVPELIGIGCDQLSKYRPAIAVRAKKIMDKLCQLGYFEPFDFGRGKGKYRSTAKRQGLTYENLAKIYLSNK